MKNPDVMVALDMPAKWKRNWQYSVSRIKEAGCTQWKVHDPFPGLDLRATAFHLRKSVRPGKSAVVMYDNKEFDVESRIVQAVSNQLTMGFDLVTVHVRNDPEVFEALRKAKLSQSVVGVLMLTSHTNEYSMRMHGRDLSEMNCFLADIARNYDLHGLVCRAGDIPLLKPRVGNTPFMTPGVYLPGQIKSNDQPSAVTPQEAFDLGSSCLIMGRGIYGTDDSPAKKPWRNFVRATWQARKAARASAAA